ncbi:UNVERIFIED_CONTAM: hypothetical protein PYX00_004213 [Menopon gallinae]|uniref:Uncharacterized protein n=1 Tax=Menopon gallinae TaxID=328185 RepID=A0AAW2I5F2_9NEOP
MKWADSGTVTQRKSFEAPKRPILLLWRNQVEFLKKVQAAPTSKKTDGSREAKNERKEGLSGNNNERKEDDRDKVGEEADRNSLKRTKWQQNRRKKS